MLNINMTVTDWVRRYIRWEFCGTRQGETSEEDVVGLCQEAYDTFWFLP